MAFRCQRPTWDEETKKCLVMAPPQFPLSRAWSDQCDGERGVGQATKMTSRNIALCRRNAATDVPFENSFLLEKTSKLAKYSKSHFAALPQFPTRHGVRSVARVLMGNQRRLQEFILNPLTTFRTMNFYCGC